MNSSDQSEHQIEIFGEEQINIEETAENLETVKPRRSFPLGKLISLLFILICTCAIGALIFGNSMLNSSSAFGNGKENKSVFSQLSQLGTILKPSSRQPIKGESAGRTNILLIGRDNSGGNTDSIMIASYFSNEKKVVTFSIPRDLFVSDEYGEYKINALYPYAEAREEGSGEQYLADFLEKEFDIPIHYWASVDFNSVEEIVDTLGGIEIDVKNEFTDYEYPDKNYGYINPSPTFKKGPQIMDGATALIYSRSRHANYDTGVEAGDFARSKRQSIVIEAILTKLQKNGGLGNATKISSFYNIVDKYVKTSLRLDEIVSLGLSLKQEDKSNSKVEFSRVVLEDDGKFLCSSKTTGGLYILSYCDGSIPGKSAVSKTRNEIRKKFSNVLNNENDQDVLEADVAIVGNQSFEIGKAYRKLIDEQGLNSKYYTESFQGIKPATANSLETTTLYIKDPKLKTSVSNLLSQNDIDYIISGEIPKDKALPKGFEEADIIVYVESK
jgi:polyisoprenyl-teichoic acid--peptidoglycan teichoic acid transferase